MTYALRWDDLYHTCLSSSFLKMGNWITNSGHSPIRSSKTLFLRSTQCTFLQHEVPDYFAWSKQHFPNAKAGPREIIQEYTHQICFCLAVTSIAYAKVLCEKSRPLKAAIIFFISVLLSSIPYYRSLQTSDVYHFPPWVCSCVRIIHNGIIASFLVSRSSWMTITSGCARTPESF